MRVYKNYAKPILEVMSVMTDDVILSSIVIDDQAGIDVGGENV